MARTAFLPRSPNRRAVRRAIDTHRRVVPFTLPRELDWIEYAACQSMAPELFFLPDYDDNHASEELTLPGRLICQTCYVRSECLDYALRNDEPTGIWGGLTTTQRRKLRRGIKRGA